MNKEELQKKITEYYKKLPTNMQTYFAGQEWIQILEEISVKYGLNENQIKILGSETTLLLLGMISLDEYEKLIRSELIIKEELFQKILTEIKEKILNQKEKDLEETFNKNVEEETIKISEELNSKFENLPEDIKNIIQNSEYEQQIYNIAKKHSLSISQADSLEREIISVMIGETPIHQFDRKLIKELKIDTEEGLEIIKEINNTIFMKIRESLKKISQKDDKEDLENLALNEKITQEDIKVDLSKDPAEKTNKFHNIFNEKLTNPVKIEVATTDHSISRDSIDKKDINTQKDQKYPPKIDPYLEKPE